MTHAQDDPPIDGKKCTRLGVNEDKGHMPYASALRPHPQEASQQGGAPPHQEKNAAALLSLFLSQKGAHFSLLPSLHVATLGQEGKLLFREPLRLMCKLRSL